MNNKGGRERNVGSGTEKGTRMQQREGIKISVKGASGTRRDEQAEKLMTVKIRTLLTSKKTRNKMSDVFVVYVTKGCKVRENGKN